MDAVVRMGEATVTSRAGDTLACIGLGSCIGLTIVDRAAGVVALAHIMLPAAAQADPPQPFKFADLAVPALRELALGAGASRLRLEAALVGGAAMFALGSGSQDIGARNAAAVKEQLDRLRVPVRATATGGSKGRTVRVTAGPRIAIAVRVAGGADTDLLSAPDTRIAA